jgi:hypothetical protein
MAKPNGITRDHVLDAMTYIGSDPSAWPHHSGSTVYDVIDPRNGARLPPKLVLTIAARVADGTRRQLYRTFGGGEQTNKQLELLGFSVLRKSCPKTDMAQPTTCAANWEADNDAHRT